MMAFLNLIETNPCGNRTLRMLYRQLPDPKIVKGSEDIQFALIVGCGINVNQESFPGDLMEASSLRLQAGRGYDRFEILQAVLTGLKRWLDDLSPDNLVPIMGAIKSRMALLERTVTVEIGFPGLGSFGGRRITGTAVDVDEQGRLVVRTAAGRFINVSAGSARVARQTLPV